MNVAVIPARGGSKRIPRKNIREFHGKPILAYSIWAAFESMLFDEVWVSTEDEEIALVAEEFDATVVQRPPELAEIGAPDCGTNAVVAHAIAGFEFDYACCIYPCAPLLKSEDLRSAFKIIQESYWDCVYAPGVFYFAKPEWFKDDSFSNTLAMLSHEGRFIDINTERDWKRAEKMYASLHKAAA